jgi:hypothetical protein
MTGPAWDPYHKQDPPAPVTAWRIGPRGWIAQKLKIELNITSKKKKVIEKIPNGILLYSQIYAYPNVIREVSSSNWQKQMQRPTTKH